LPIPPCFIIVPLWAAIFRLIKHPRGQAPDWCVDTVKCDQFPVYCIR
jgi:hypothetical protein